MTASIMSEKNYNTNRPTSKLTIVDQLVKDEQLFPKSCAAYNILEDKLPPKRSIQQLGFLFSRLRSHQLRNNLAADGHQQYADSPLFIGCLMAIDILTYKFNLTSGVYRSGVGSPFRRAIAANVFAGQLLGCHRRRYGSYKEVRTFIGVLHEEVFPKLEEMGLLKWQKAIPKAQCRIYDTRPLNNYLGRWLLEEIRRERKARFFEEGVGVFLLTQEDDRSGPAGYDPEIMNPKHRHNPSLLGCVRYLNGCRSVFNLGRWNRKGFSEVREYAVWNYAGLALVDEQDRLLELLKTETDDGKIREIQDRLVQLDESLNAMDERVLAAERSVLYSLDGLNMESEKPQFFGEWHLQGPGRIHTDGGAVWLPKTLRWLYIQPVNPDNIALELDLKSCQLIIALKILSKEFDGDIRTDCDELLAQVKSIAKRGDSVWKHIVPNQVQGDIPKPALKVLVYSLVFGCSLGQGMLQLVNAELRADGHSFQFSQGQINEILRGFLKPLVTAREKWMEKYSITNIQNSSLYKLPDRMTNAAGHVFHLRKEAKEYSEHVELDQAQWQEDEDAGRRKSQAWKPQLNDGKIAGRALAHMCQGYEAYIMQSFIASEAMQENILAFQFDGLTVECHPSRVVEVKARYEKWLSEFDADQTFEFVPLWFARNWVFFWATECEGNYSRSAIDTLENDFDLVNKDRRHCKDPSNRKFCQPSDKGFNRGGFKVHSTDINYLLWED